MNEQINRRMNPLFNLSDSKYLEQPSDFSSLYIEHQFSDFFLSSLSRFNHILNYMFKYNSIPDYVISNTLYNTSYYNPNNDKFNIDNTFVYFKNYQDIDFPISNIVLHNLPKQLGNLSPFKIHHHVIHYILYKYFSPSQKILYVCNKLLKKLVHTDCNYKSSCIIPIFTRYLRSQEHSIKQIYNATKTFSILYPSTYIFIVSDCIQNHNIQKIFSNIPNLVIFDVNNLKYSPSITLLSTIIVASKFKHCIIKHHDILELWTFFYKHLFQDLHSQTQSIKLH